MQFDLIKEVLTGSITGYITNAIAIKMIFREYGIGKFKVGGIVVKTKEEFIDNVSSLVERDIINAETLSNELRKESFRSSIKKFVDDILNTYIFENTSNLSLGEVEGVHSTINNLQSYIKGSVNEHLPSAFDSLCKNIYLKDLVSEKQAQHISGELFSCVLDELNNKDFIEKTISNFYSENKDLNFGEFFGEKLMDIVIKNFENNAENFHVDLKIDFDTHIDNAFDNTIETLEIHKILSSLEENLLEKSIVDFINADNNTNLSKSLISKVKDFLGSNEGKILINKFGNELINALKSIDKPISDLFSDGLKENIEEFFKDKLQYAVKEIILWIEKNKEDIEGLIEKAIDDTVESIDDDMKKNVVNMVRDKFTNDMMKKFDIVSKITEYLDENADIDSISKDITLIIIKYLKEEKVSDVIMMLEKNKILTEESFADFITHNVISYLDYIPEDYLSGFLNKKLKDVFNTNLVGIFESQGKKSLKNVIKNKYLYTENITKLFTKELTKSLKNINTSKLGELITKEILPSSYDSIKKLMIEGLTNNENSIRDSFCKELINSIDSFNLYKGLNDELRKNLLDEVINGILNKTDNLLEDCKDIEFKKVYDKINNIENVNDILTDSMISTLKDSLQDILKGNIKKAVSNNLYNLKDEELQVMVEEFMGKEMKPITVIGALLGGIAGIGMYFFDKSTAQYSYFTGTLISIVVYGLVGWITNVQALAMLFKPYTEKRLFGIKIPFTPGVIVSRKPKFAKSMSAFVDEELLKKSTIEELFNKNKDIIYNKLQETIANDNYKIVRDFSIQAFRYYK